MKLKYINEIADTCCEFMEQVIGLNTELSVETLIKYAKDVVNNIDWRWADEDLIIFDYKRMTFYVRRKDDKWFLDKEAVFNHRDISEPIELEV